MKECRICSQEVVTETDLLIHGAENHSEQLQGFTVRESRDILLR